MTKAPVKQQPLSLPALGWHKPGVLSCPASLSNDEVFTAPAVAYHAGYAAAEILQESRNDLP